MDIEGKGLSTSEAKQRLASDGPNRIEAKKQSPLLMFFKWLISPISLMLLAAAILSLISNRFTDASIILFLFCTNFVIKLWHEHKADRAIEALQENLESSVKTLRDGAWTKVSSALLVKGDIVELVVGSIVPADAKLLEGKNLSINESMLTGESLPVEKEAGGDLYSGSFLATGYATAEVRATGARTYFGKTLVKTETLRKRSLLEKDILTISRFLSAISIAVMILLTVFLLAAGGDLLSVTTLDLSLLIAGIPVALPTVMSLIISIGVLELAKKSVVVRRLSSLEDLSNVNLLLSDKTGTLTENKIHIERLIPIGDVSEERMLEFAESAALDAEYNAIDAAVIDTAKERNITPFKRTDYIPADSTRKRSTAFVAYEGGSAVVSFGAPHTIASLCNFHNDEEERFNKGLEEGAQEGKRVLALAFREGGEEKNLHMLGLFLLADRVRDDAKDVISFLCDEGVDVKMVTGDTREVGASVARELGLKGEVVGRELFDDDGSFSKRLGDISAFAEVLPEDKLKAVTTAKERYVVAVTGDGVNDLPAVKAADVGIAVKNAVHALRNTADIVLLSNGIAVIKDAIIEARKVFARVYNYSVYRISESFRLIITIAIIGLIYKTYPLLPVQIILLALLNDVPIITLAFDRVKTAAKPAHIDVKKRAIQSTLFGTVGIVNSMLMLLIATKLLHLPWELIQTVFFLKLTVSGHMLLYVAHTKERWYKYLPSKEVIWATTITQLIATGLAFFGFIVPAISWQLILFIWVWSFFWMQIAELTKWLRFSKSS